MNSRVGHIWFMVVASTFFWGSNFNCAQILANSVGPLTAAGERFFVAVVLFWVMRYSVGNAESTLSRKDFWRLVPLGLLGVFGFNYAFFTALHTTTALNASLVMSLSPLLSTIFSVLLLGSPILMRQYWGMLIAFAGVCLVITGGNFGLVHVAVGDLYMLFACGVWSLYTVGAKRFSPNIPPLQFARWTVTVGGIALILAALVLERPLSDISHLSIKTHSILIYMGICGSLLAYIFWLKGVHFLGPAKSAIAFNLVPIFTLIVNLALGILPNYAQIIGMLMALVGVLISIGWRPAFMAARGI